MSLERFEVILFDIGGVLVELTGIQRMMAWTQGRHSVEQLWEKWLLSTAGRLFESGRITPDQFARQMVDEFDLPITPGEFILSFRHWISGPFPGALELLAELGRSHRVASLSNTNAMHWERMRDEMGLVACFHENFPSHETGLVKPDHDAFRHVIERLGCSPGAVLYFDDSALNIRSAGAVGLVARRVDGLKGVESVLRELGIV